MAFDPTTAQAVSQQSSGFDPSSAKLAEETPQESGSVNLSGNTPPGTFYKSALGGVLSAEGTAAETIGDAGIWAARKLGRIGQAISGSSENTNLSPEEAQRARDALHYTLAQNVGGVKGSLYPEEQKGNPLGEAMKAAPGIAEGTKTLTNIGNITAFSGNPFKGYMGGITNIASNALLGAGAGSNEAQQDKLAMIGGALGAGGELLAKTLTTAAKGASLASTLVQRYLKPVYDDLIADGNMSVGEKAVKAESMNTAEIAKIADTNYNDIKAIPGTIKQAPISAEASKILTKNGSKFTEEGVLDHSASRFDPPQIKVLTNASQEAAQMTNMEDALRLKQYLGRNQPLFRGANVTDSQFKQYQSLQQTIQQAIADKAEAAGKTDILNKADSYWKDSVVPLQESGSFDRMEAVKAKDIRDANYVKQVAEAKKAGQPAPPPPPISSDYTKAIKQITPNAPKMTPQDFVRVSRSMGEQGSQIMQDHLVEQTFKSALQPATFDKNSTLLKVNNILDKYKSVLSPDTQKTIEGAKVLLEEAGATPEAAKLGTKSGTVSKFISSPWAMTAAAGGSVGGFEGYREGGVGGIVKGMLLGGAAGIAAAGGASIGKGLLNTTYGHELLRYIADHPETARGLINNLVQAPVQKAPDFISNQANIVTGGGENGNP